MQKWAGRVNTPLMVENTTPANDDKLLVEGTWYFEEGDTVDVVAVDAKGCIVSVIDDNRTVDAIDPGLSLTLDAAVDTTGLPAGQTPYILCQTILSAQQSIDRLYKRKFSGEVNFRIREPILSQDISGGQGIYYVADVSFIRPGDKFDIQDDDGLVVDDVTVQAVNPNADEANNLASVTLTTNPDSLAANPLFISQDITVQEAIWRNQERIDEIDRPIENEYIGTGDGSFTVFDVDNLFRFGSSKLWLDSGRLRLGTAGTRSFLEQGTYPGDDDSLKFTSMILGTAGDLTTVEVAAGAGFTIVVTGKYSTGYVITINDNTGAATAAEIAAALNADADVKRILQAQWGGDGSGVVAPFGPTALAAGANDGTGDYAEIPQIYNNLIVNTGYKWVSLHIRTNEQNRMKVPPKCSEELVIDYREPMENVDR